MLRAVILGLASLGLASAAYAQAYVPPPSIDPTTLATQDQVQAALTAAQAAQANACPAASVVPPMESVGGAPGAAVTCRRSDAVQPRITRAAVVVTDSSGNWSVTWSSGLAAVPVVLPLPVNTTTEPIVCNVTTRTATGATGRCWLARTLPATLTLLSGLVSYDAFGASAAGVSVQLLAIPVTQ